MQDYPRYSELMQCLNLSRRLTVIRDEIEHYAAVNTGSLVRSGSIRTGKTGRNITEEAALKLIDLREEEEAKSAEWKKLFIKLTEEIKNGPGDERTRDIIAYYYAFDVGFISAVKMAGFTSRKKAKEAIDTYTRAAYLNEYEGRKRNEEQY